MDGSYVVARQATEQAKGFGDPSIQAARKSWQAAIGVVNTIVLVYRTQAEAPLPIRGIGIEAAGQLAAGSSPQREKGTCPIGHKEPLGSREQRASCTDVRASAAVAVTATCLATSTRERMPAMKVVESAIAFADLAIRRGTRPRMNRA